ncbi:hypothetical protein C9374_004441 [Naegleria lovaniensis]|uniref:Uncharacterized protein n=1 Tax=Naegleria lovaniensis TaxID=51637 RepID=A0AA88KIR0_NAELO|nr:uncharacterized protein C9374_004441 [Naegleria lovaniensis]KAG2383104.1 hypothetical protein C9374_004441 [Naegleria lovaniensis]
MQEESVTVKLFNNNINQQNNALLNISPGHRHGTEMSDKEFQKMIMDLRKERMMLEKKNAFHEEEDVLHDSASSTGEPLLTEANNYETQALNVLQNYILKEFENVKGKLTKEVQELDKWAKNSLIDESGNGIDTEDQMIQEDGFSLKSVFLEQYRVDKIFLDRLSTIYNNFNKEYFSFSKASTLLELHNSTTEVISEYQRMSQKFSKAISESQNRLPSIDVTDATPTTFSNKDFYHDVSSDDDDSDDESEVERVDGTLLTDHILANYREDDDASPSYSITTSSTVITGPFSPLITPNTNRHPTTAIFPHKDSSISNDTNAETEDASILDSSNSNNVNNNNHESMNSTRSVETVCHQHMLPNETLDTPVSLTPMNNDTVVIELLHIIIDQSMEISNSFNHTYAKNFYKHADLNK